MSMAFIIRFSDQNLQSETNDGFFSIYHKWLEFLI